MVLRRRANAPLVHVGLVIYGRLGQTTGGYRYNRKLVSGLRDRGDRVDVIRIERRPYPRAILDAASRPIRAVLDRPYDVLLQDGICHPSVWWHNRRLAAPGAVVALVHHLRSADPTDPVARLAEPLERRFLRSVDAVVATSGDLRARARDLAPATRPRLVAHPAGRVEGVGVSLQRVRERARERPLRVCFVGSLAPRKDPLTLLDAVAAASTPAELTVVGSETADPAYAGRVRRHASDLGIDDSVSVLGTVTDRRLEANLADSHVCCVPSRYEGFGMAHLEAMEYGVVPVATTRGGPREFVSDGENGFLVAPGAGRAIAARFDALADSSRLERMAAAALETAASHPDWAETVGRIRSFCAGLG